MSEQLARRSIRSFVIREGRFTEAQKRAFEMYWPTYGIDTDTPTVIDLQQYFKKAQPMVMDVGFGAGDSLISLAQQRPDYNFLGIEVYRPGIGAVLQKIHALEIDNIRIINNDVLDLLTHNIASDSFAAAMIWFPDPWPKQKHSKRRLIQKEFLLAVSRALTSGAILHLASDWQPYVKFMQKQATQLQEVLQTLQCEHNPLGLQRPATRFEQRGLRRGHQVSDLFYKVCK